VVGLALAVAEQPTDVRNVAEGPVKRRRKRGGSCSAARCRLAIRNASAGAAMSDSSECGDITKSMSISPSRSGIFGHPVQEIELNQKAWASSAKLGGCLQFQFD
jgi:hypothetical protein